MDNLPARLQPFSTRSAPVAGLLAALIPLLFTGSAVAERPPFPVPNPDRPARTPVLQEGAHISAHASCPRMRGLARSGNGSPALMVKSLDSGRVICSLNAGASRSLASNTKIFTTVTALGRLGPSATFRTRVYAAGKVDRRGVLRGSLYLRGGGDPTLGTGRFLDAYLGGAGSDINRLAAQVRRSGIKAVTGRLYGDDTVFDRLRGVADSGYGTSPYIGPLSGLSFNAGFTDSSLYRFSSDPAKLATRSFARALRSRGVNIRSETAMRPTPAALRKTRPVGILVSPDMGWMARLTNLDSNNFFAEMLLKNIGARIRRAGTTRTGARVVRGFIANRFDATVRPVDGSGLTRGNRSSTGDVVKLLTRIRSRPWFGDFFGSLPTAGRDGTLADRMRGSAAQGRCHAKTGTLTGVSALSGYCYNRSGRKFAFSILMNSVYNTYSARAAQDRIAAMIAGF
jgi:D-alanyl-D-alanine carboxypeptidase/D-alanyl-D-alanine-endopeptidase (penicillin-binding protein 4)